MNISSAYIFGKQIKASAAPSHEHWYYFNGRFNTELMPSGFTNFQDKLVTFRGATGTLNYNLEYANTNYLSSYMGTPYIPQLLGEHADSWELTDNVLKRVQTGDIPLSADPWNDYHGAILFPLAIPNTFTKAHIKYEFVGESINIIYKTDFKLRIQSNGGSLGALSEAEATPEQAGEYEEEVTIYSYSQSYVGYKYFQFEPYLVTREVRVKEIWFT